MFYVSCFVCNLINMQADQKSPVQFVLELTGSGLSVMDKHPDRQTENHKCNIGYKKCLGKAPVLIFPLLCSKLNQGQYNIFFFGKQELFCQNPRGLSKITIIGK